MFNKLLIANRGEIACRIIKTARRMGIESVAIYSTADRESLHVKLADSAFCIGDPAASKSYLNMDAIIATAIASKAQAIHPGYGFLSENPHFARACEAAGIVFVGPSIFAMEAMASKQFAKQLLEKTTIPLTPGYHGKDQSDEQLLIQAIQIGFPVLLKAAAGGGGKGMRAVYQKGDFKEALAGARREAMASFADDTMLIEKLIIEPRHVEIQIMADNHGNIVHLFERDCSIQRRHQKIIEEAPAPNLPNTLRKKLGEAAIAVAQKIDYRGAGTVEFLVDKDFHFYFMEMNTRLQVEHPVTEMITRLDLVEWQLRIAANEPLPATQEKIHAYGHAIECRIYAEDPEKEFIPSIGQLHFIELPEGDGLRIDTGVERGSNITMYYDPMIAKLIAWGENRTEALQRLQQALKHYHIGGVKTNIAFLQGILKQPAFMDAHLSTHFLNKHPIKTSPIPKQEALIMAASMEYLNQLNTMVDPLYKDTFSWQMHLPTHWYSRYLIHGEQLDVKITPIDKQQLTLEHAQKTFSVRANLTKNTLNITDNHHLHLQALIDETDGTLTLYTSDGAITVESLTGLFKSNATAKTNHKLTAPMPSTVVAILKNIGDTIKAGERLMVLEAMKMEHTIHAPNDGLLAEIFYEIGAQVNEGAELGRIVTPP